MGKMTFEVDWQPLEKLLAPKSCRHFMYMATCNMPDDTQIMLYKHVETRSYLNIDKDGNFYRYDGAANTYSPTTREKAAASFANDGFPLIFNNDQTT